MRPGQERQEKALHLSLIPVSCVAWASALTSLIFSFLICKIWYLTFKYALRVKD